MKVDLSSLPEDVTSLKEIIFSYEELRQENDSRYLTLENNLTELRERNALLEEQLRLYRAMFYGRKSEKNSEAEKTSWSVQRSGEDGG